MRAHSNPCKVSLHNVHLRALLSLWYVSSLGMHIVQIKWWQTSVYLTLFLLQTGFCYKCLLRGCSLVSLLWLMYEGNKPSLLHNGTDYFGYLRYLLLYMYLRVLAIVRTGPPDLSVFNYNAPFLNTRLFLQIHHKGAYYFQIDQACWPVLTNNGIIWFNELSGQAGQFWQNGKHP